MTLPTSMRDVPESHTAFERARQLQERAAAQGFDWPELADIWAKVFEELDELAAGIAQHDALNTAEEMGDVLFALTNLARRLGVDPAAALEATNQKFITRFETMAQLSVQTGIALKDQPLERQLALYQQAKTWLASADASLK